MHRPRAAARDDARDRVARRGRREQRDVAPERVANDDRLSRRRVAKEPQNARERDGQRDRLVAPRTVPRQVGRLACEAARQRALERQPRLSIRDGTVQGDDERCRQRSRRNVRAMAESDRQRLLSRALALATADASDFFGERRPPDDVDPELIKRIDDTSLRTKLVDARIAEGLQSPKGPQKIASIIRVYPDFDAPPKATRSTSGGGSSTTAHPRNGASAASPARALPSVAEMERLLARYREIEADVARELSSDIEDRIARLKRSLADLDGNELDAAYRELGKALDDRHALDSQIRHETFARIERDNGFAERVYLRLLARSAPL